MITDYFDMCLSRGLADEMLDDQRCDLRYERVRQHILGLGDRWTDLLDLFDELMYTDDGLGLMLEPGECRFRASYIRELRPTMGEDRVRRYNCKIGELAMRV